MSRRSSKVTLSTAFLALAATVGAGTLAGCGSDSDTYCGDDQGYVLPAEECEDDDGAGFIYMGSYGGSRYKVGDKLPAVTGGQRVRANDSAGRSRIGIPARGGFGGNGGRVSSGG